MNKLDLSNTGGLPLRLNDIEWILGQNAYDGGINYVLNNLFKDLGSNFIIYGCTLSGATVNAGLIMLDGEILVVDTHAKTSTHFEKVTTYNTDGQKNFHDGTPHDTYHKIRATCTASSGSLQFVSAPRLNTLLKVHNANFAYTAKETIKGRVINYKNPTTINLDDSKAITVTSGSGNIYLVAKSGAFETLANISDSSEFSYGEELIIKFLNDTFIEHSGVLPTSISTPAGETIKVTAGTIVKFICDPQSFIWQIVYLSKEYLYTSRINTRKKKIEIGAWDMDTDYEKAVAHGLDNPQKILSIYVMIFRDDLATSVYPLTNYSNPTDLFSGGVSFVNGTNIVMHRKDGSIFDSSSYNSTSINRGIIFIEYEI